ncbi:unnamed protein product [Cochlearia groenlandica]
MPRMNKSPRIDIPSPSLPSVSDNNSADGEFNEDDIFSIDITTHAPRHSPLSSPSQQQQHRRHLQRSKSGLKNVEASGILAALPETTSGGNSYLSHVFHHHKPASSLSTSPSSSSPGGGGGGGSSSARAIPSAPKPTQERLPSFKYPQSAPVQVPLVSIVNRRKKEFKLTDIVDEDEEEGEMLPPHEIVARSLAQSSLLSCSVLEGAGRTLKGRDLRQVRNAVFRRTGFID